MEFKSIENFWTNQKAGEPEHPFTPAEWEALQKALQQVNHETSESSH